MLPDRVSNPGPRLTNQVPYRLRFAARPFCSFHRSKGRGEKQKIIWLVGCFGLNGPLRQYFSLYRTVSQRQGKKRREKIEASKNVQTTLTRTYCKRNRPLPYYHPNCRTPRHWKFTQHLRTTLPPPSLGDGPT